MLCFLASRCEELLHLHLVSEGNGRQPANKHCWRKGGDFAAIREHPERWPLLGAGGKHGLLADAEPKSLMRERNADFRSS